MPYVEVSMPILSSPENIYPIIKDMEKYPLFMKDLVSVKVLQRHENMTITEWVSNVDGRVIKWRERDVFDDENMHIAYEQTEGDLKRFAGEWCLEQVEDKTIVTLKVDFEFGIPMISGLLNPILKKKVRENSENMLKAVKERIENAK